VTVKDTSGRLVDGLTKNDFSIFENGAPQRLALFTSDPFPLSVGVVLDSNLPDETLRKVRATLPALVGAFSEYDEAGIFSYGNSVQQQLTFTGSPQQIGVALKHASEKGRANGPPVVSGPMTGMPSPTVNGKPFDPSMPHVSIAQRESAVLNDAILAAATALSKRDRARRKIIFVISDGREDGSQASYSDVLKVLLSNNISVYALAVDAGAIPGYKTLQGVHIPLLGYGNILGKYVSATAGETFAEFTQDSIENAYARITGDARNQYTLGYTTRETAASDYRSIEVRVHRSGLDVRAKDGYYPLPPER
jgi:VWFA-related protein